MAITIHGTLIEKRGSSYKLNNHQKMKNSVVFLNDSSFNNAISQGTTLVDFWAEWCGPCRMQGPILDELATEIGEKAIISKLNVDDNRSIAGKYGIMSIPTLILFKDGKPVKQFVGVQNKKTLINAINEIN